MSLITAWKIKLNVIGSLKMRKLRHREVGVAQAFKVVARVKSKIELTL